MYHRVSSLRRAPRRLIAAAGLWAVGSWAGPESVGPAVSLATQGTVRTLPERFAAPRSYDAPRAASPPAIDGVLDDAAWQAAPWTESFIDIRGDDWPAPEWDTRAKIVWDDDHLYVAAQLEEPHLWATLAERDDILYHEHDFEVFIDPDGDALDYYELEVNALGTEFDLFLPRPYNRRGRANVGWDMVGLRTAVALDGTLNDPSDEDRGWTAEIAIPWSAFRPPEGGAAADDPRETDRYATGAGGRHMPGTGPRAGDEWRINFLAGAVAGRDGRRRIPEGGTPVA